jgi:hypothetical protein
MNYPVSPRINYLSKTNAATVQSDGTAIVRLSPSVGEYWSPMMVRISTTSGITSYCAIFHGGSTTSDATTFIDDTYLGNGDASSFIAGTIVQYGDSIIAKWSGGNTGDAAILTIYGTYSNLPPSQGYALPSTPGSHFGGHINSEQLITLYQIPFGLSLPAHGTTTILTNFDVRPFTSYYFDIFASGPVTPTAYNTVTVTLTFQDGQGQDCYVDTYEFFVSQAGAFPFASGTVMIQDKIHGPVVKIALQNNNNDIINIGGGILIGTSRDISQPFVRQEVNGVAGNSLSTLNSGVDGILVNTNGFVAIANGATLNFPTPLSYGRFSFNAQPGAGGLGILIGAGLTVNAGDLDTQVIAANTAFYKEYIAPKRALFIVVNNGSGVASTIKLHVFTLFDKV